MSWKTRTSSLGYYNSCELRAVLDRMISNGQIKLDALGIEEQARHGPYTSFGTLVHAAWQRGLNAQFDPTSADNEDLSDAEHMAHVVGNMGCATAADVAEAVARTVEAAIKHTKTICGLEHWKAETNVKTDILTGHIDLLSTGHGLLIDLKTASRKPMHNRPKPIHVMQMLGYYILLRRAGLPVPVKGSLLYVESVKARWTINCEIDYTNKHVLDEINKLERLCERLLAVRLEDANYHFGEHCRTSYCPYAKSCYDSVIPSGGQVKTHAGQPKAKATGVGKLANPLEML